MSDDAAPSGGDGGGGGGAKRRRRRRGGRGRGGRGRGGGGSEGEGSTPGDGSAASEDGGAASQTEGGASREASQGDAGDGGRSAGRTQGGGQQGGGQHRGGQRGGGSKGGDRRGGGRSGGGGQRRGSGGGGGERVDQAQFRREAKARAEERWSLKDRPMGLPDALDPPPKQISLEWPVQPVPGAVERRLHDIVVRRGEFGWLPDSRVDEIAEVVRSMDISLEQALSLRSALLQQKTVRNHSRIQRRADQLLRRYENGTDILELAKDVDGPPVNVFRAILTARKWSKTRIKEALRDADARLSKRDAEQFHKAEEGDRVSNVDQSETQDRAEEFEDVLCHYFDLNGVRYRAQPELVAEQQAKHGRSVRTPDLLLLDQVTINGEPVAWLDAKHFYGADVAFPRKKTAQQVKRYVEAWGQGAIIYRHGFCADLDIPGAILLDASVLDTDRMSPPSGGT